MVWAAAAGAQCVAPLAGQAPSECNDVVFDTWAALTAFTPTSGILTDAPLGVSWTAKGPTNAAVDIRPKPGTPQVALPTLTSTAPADQGSLAWDLNDTTGAPAPDGSYALVLRALDAPAGSATRGGSVIVDRTAPTLRLLSRPVLRTRALSVRISEFGSGIVASVLSIDGKPRVAATSPREGQNPTNVGAGAKVVIGRLAVDLTFRPIHGWKPGRHTFTLTGRDQAGHVASPLTGSFTLPRRR